MIKVAICGYGYWGPNLVRNFSSNQHFMVHTVVDSRAERLGVAKKSFPAIQTSQSLSEVLNHSDVDAVVVATPVSTHFEIAEKAILSGKHVLIEKPMTGSVQQALRLIDLSGKHSKALMVDHTFLYTGAVQKIKSLVDDQSVGKLQYFDSTRINLGLFQSDVNVLWDLAVHDLSILNFIHSEPIYSVQAIGASHTQSKIENLAYLIVRYESGFIAHLNCSWISPVKIRQILIGGDKKMIVYNDIEPTEKIKIYDSGFTVRSDEDRAKLFVDYRTGDVFVPKLDIKEALSGVVADFALAISENKTPRASSESGLQVVKVLEAADQSLRKGGSEILLGA